MQFSKSIIAFGLFALVASSPMPKKNKNKDQAASSCDSDVDAAASSSNATVASASASASAVASATAVVAESSASETASASADVAATGADVLTASAYADFQISTGTGGDAEAKANALFADLPSDLSQVTANDLDVIKGIHDVAEDAEVQAFNPAIDAATGADADALQVGKIQNKVLKLTAEVLGIQVEAAQGGDDSDLAEEQTKLANNIATDKASAGEASQSVDFDGTS